MRLTHIELHELALPLSEPFIISGGTMTVRRSLVVVIHDAGGYIGYGESPPFELPFYSEETLGSARLLLAELLDPPARRPRAREPRSGGRAPPPGRPGQPVRTRGARDRRRGTSRPTGGA